MTELPESYLLYGNTGYIPQNAKQILKTSKRFIFLFLLSDIVFILLLWSSQMNTVAKVSCFLV